MFTFLYGKNRQSVIAREARSSFRPRLEALEDRCLLSGGILDPTFGTAGGVITNVGAHNSFSAARAVATYPSNDGRIVTAGFAAVSIKGGWKVTDDFALVRYNLDGSLDTSFGSGGEVLTSLGSASETAEDVAIQPDGKIVAAGLAGGQLALVRYNTNGSLDTSFAGTGKILGNISTGSTDAAYRISLQADGKIVVAGTSDGNLFLERYNSNGTLDSNFGTGGKVTTQFNASLDVVFASGQGMDLAVDPNTSPLDQYAGEIVVVAQLQGGSGFGPVVVARYNTDGTLDTGFGAGSGYVSLSTLDIAPAVAIQSDDRVVVSGNSASARGEGVAALARFNTDGTPDSSFGSGGLTLTPLPNLVTVDALLIQANGQIVIAGTRSIPPANTLAGNFLLARYNATDGSLDDSFGNQGVAVSSGVSVYIEGQVDVALEPDGRIVVAGDSAGSTFALSRFLAAGPEIGTFSANSDSVAAGGSLTLTASGITDANPGATVTQVAFYVSINGSNTQLGNVTQTSPGVWTSSFTVNLAPGTYTVYAQAEDSYGVFGDPVALTLTVS
jgi:uncharacterized delta-60 repeat protein